MTRRAGSGKDESAGTSGGIVGDDVGRAPGIVIEHVARMKIKLHSNRDNDAVPNIKQIKK